MTCGTRPVRHCNPPKLERGLIPVTAGIPGPSSITTLIASSSKPSMPSARNGPPNWRLTTFTFGIRLMRWSKVSASTRSDQTEREKFSTEEKPYDHSEHFQTDGKNAIHDGIEREPGGGKALLDSTDDVENHLGYHVGQLER